MIFRVCIWEKMERIGRELSGEPAQQELRRNFELRFLVKESSRMSSVENRNCSVFIMKRDTFMENCVELLMKKLIIIFFLNIGLVLKLII